MLLYTHINLSASLKRKGFLLFECGGHSNNKSNEDGGLHASKIKNCGVDLNKKGVIHHDSIRECKENI